MIKMIFGGVFDKQMKYLFFFGVVAAVLFYALQQRKRLLAQQQRLAQERQAEFAAEMDALNPHLRRECGNNRSNNKVR